MGRHIHVPQGAIPKDGPSAGITMLTALASAFTQRKVRKYLAMSGKSRCVAKCCPWAASRRNPAAKRAGIKEIILCERNRKDVDDINPRYIKGLSFTYVTHMREVVDRALLGQQVDNPLRVVAS